MSNKDELIQLIIEADSKEALEPIAESLGYKFHGNKGLQRTQDDLLELLNGGEDAPENDADTAPEEAEPEVKADLPRRFRNKKTGVEFTYTPGMEKMSHLEEV